MRNAIGDRQCHASPLRVLNRDTVLWRSRGSMPRGCATAWGMQRGEKRKLSHVAKLVLSYSTQLARNGLF